MEQLIYCIAIWYPLWIILLFSGFRSSEIARYFFLSMPTRGFYPRKAMRQAGVAWFCFGVWMLAAAFAIGGLIPKDVQDSSIGLLIMAVIAFGVPTLALIAIALGLYFLSKGIFSTRKQVRSEFRAGGDVLAEDFSRLVKRCRLYLLLHIVASLWLLGVFVTAYFWAPPDDSPLTVVSVVALITLVLTNNACERLLDEIRSLLHLASRPDVLELLTHFPVVGVWADSFNLREVLLHPERYESLVLQIAHVDEEQPYPTLSSRG